MVDIKPQENHAEQEVARVLSCCINFRSMGWVNPLRTAEAVRKYLCGLSFKRYINNGRVDSHHYYPGIKYSLRNDDKQIGRVQSRWKDLFTS